MPRESKTPKDGFSIRMKQVRISHGVKLGKTRYTQADFAEALAMGTEAYSLYERGSGKPPFEKLVQIHQVTGASLDWLVLGIEPVDQAAPEKPKSKRPTLTVHQRH